MDVSDGKCFYVIKSCGLIEFVISLHGQFEHYLKLPSEVFPSNVLEGSNVVEVTDARGVVRLIKIERSDKFSCWCLCGTKWADLISSVISLDPKYVHLEQVGLKKFLVNFYTVCGDEVDYGVTNGHVTKCLVLGCKDPRLYQPIPCKMLLESKIYRNSKCVPIKVVDCVGNVRVTFHLLGIEKKLVGAAFTGAVWECLCELFNFSEYKLLVLALSENGRHFCFKLMNGFDADPVKMVGCEPLPAGVLSRDGCFVYTSFVVEYTGFIEKRGYMNMPKSFHNHQMKVGHREGWVKAGGCSFYMVIKVHSDKRQKNNRNTRVFLVGDWDRVKVELGLKMGDSMLFNLVSGDIGGDGSFCFELCKEI